MFSTTPLRVYWIARIYLFIFFNLRSFTVQPKVSSYKESLSILWKSLQWSLIGASSQARSSIIILLCIHTLSEVLPQPLLLAKILIANCSKLFPPAINPVCLQMLTAKHKVFGESCWESLCFGYGALNICVFNNHRFLATEKWHALLQLPNNCECCTVVEFPWAGAVWCKENLCFKESVICH